jgi:predicted hydrocarbon binding protein
MPSPIDLKPSYRMNTRVKKTKNEILDDPLLMPKRYSEKELVVVPCPTCRGMGDEHCPSCEGELVIEEYRKQ